MSSKNEEEIYNKLFDVVSSPLLANNLVTYASRITSQAGNTTLDSYPALFQKELPQTWEERKGVPGIVTANVQLSIYLNNSNNPDLDSNNQQVPSVQLNKILESVKQTLAIPAGQDTQTLDGFVSSAWITQVHFAEALVDNKNVLIILVALKWNEAGTSAIFDRGALFIGNMKVGSLQEVNITFDTSFKRDNTNLQSPIKFFGGANSIKGIAKFAEFDNTFIATYVFQNSVLTSGSSNVAEEFFAVPSGLTYITSGTVAKDLGSYLIDDLQNMIQVTGSPLQGQYFLSGNDYSYSSDDLGKDIRINYLYNSPTGTTWNLYNSFQQQLPAFSVVLYGSNDSRNSVLQLPYCSTSKLNIDFNVQKWSAQDFSFEAASIGTDTSLQLGTISTAV